MWFFKMLGAIYFDNQFGLGGIEVINITVNWLLAVKLYAGKLFTTPAQSLP